MKGKKTEKDERREDLQRIFEDVDPGERVLVDQLIREVCFLEETQTDAQDELLRRLEEFR